MLTAKRISIIVLTIFIFNVNCGGGGREEHIEGDKIYLSFIESIESKKYDKAYNLITDEAKNKMNLEQFIAFVEKTELSKNNIKERKSVDSRLKFKKGIVDGKLYSQWLYDNTLLYNLADGKQLKLRLVLLKKKDKLIQVDMMSFDYVENAKMPVNPAQSYSYTEADIKEINDYVEKYVYGK